MNGIAVSQLATGPEEIQQTKLHNTYTRCSENTPQVLEDYL